MLFFRILVLAVRYKNRHINNNPKAANEMMADMFAVNKLLSLFHHVFMNSSGTASILSVKKTLAISMLCWVSSLFGSNFNDFS